jgi:23S rRNA pseudouridine2605 synthase
MAEMRLQKFLAEAGIASRRASEELILEGRVSVDGIQVRVLGSKVDPEISTVEVDGEAIKLKKTKTYLAFYKPRGILSTMSDPDSRPSLGDFFKDYGSRLFHIGRLDKDSEGLILLTNDGELTHRATHPSYGLNKKYLVEIEGTLEKSEEAQILAGIQLEDGLAKADSLLKIRETKNESTWYEVVIHEGRYHIVRRMFEELEHPVLQLIRTNFGPIGIGELKPGRFRHLNEVEIENLFSVLTINR